MLDDNDRLVHEMISHGKHKNLSFFAFTATPKGATLEMFGTEWNEVPITIPMYIDASGNRRRDSFWMFFRTIQRIEPAIRL